MRVSTLYCLISRSEFQSYPLLVGFPALNLHELGRPTNSGRLWSPTIPRTRRRNTIIGGNLTSIHRRHQDGPTNDHRPQATPIDADPSTTRPASRTRLAPRQGRSRSPSPPWAVWLPLGGTSVTDLEIGDIVADRDHGSDATGQCVVINFAPTTADDWRAYVDDNGEDVTVADDNPEYPADDDVAIVLFTKTLNRVHPDWSGENPIPFSDVGAKFYSFPVSRLVHVNDDTNHTDEVSKPADGREEASQADSTEAAEAPDGVSADLQALADRLETEGMTIDTIDADTGVIRASKLGQTYVVSLDGVIEGGALTDQVEAAVREVTQ